MANIGHKMKKFSKEQFEEMSKRYWEKYLICPSCLGVGCLPEHFGMGNPDAQPCITCSGTGAILKSVNCSTIDTDT